MAQFFIFCLIIADAFMIIAVAYETSHTMTEPNVASFANPPALSPLNNGKFVGRVEPLSTRKLGRHQHKVIEPVAAPSLSPFEAPQTEEHIQSFSDERAEGGQGKDIYLKKRHHSVDKSIAGGGVILGGLATTFLVAVFCYIRATGRKSAEPSA